MCFFLHVLQDNPIARYEYARVVCQDTVFLSQNMISIPLCHVYVD